MLSFLLQLISLRQGITRNDFLSPTLHRAFDYGLMAVFNDYQVLDHPSLTDHFLQAGIRQFEGQEFKLP
jgi:hypothetical protein